MKDMKRICSKCSQEYDHYGQRSSMCKDCRRIYDRVYHASRSAETKARKQKLQNKRALRIKQVIHEWKVEIGCFFCDERESVCLDFHHIDPNEKETTIAEAISKRWSLRCIKEEARKCIIVCANCHRKLHNGLINIGE